MKATIKNIVNLALGVTSYGKDALKKLTNELQKTYGISEAEGRKLAKDLFAQTHRTRTIIHRAISEHANYIIKRTLAVRKKPRLSLKKIARHLTSRLRKRPAVPARRK